MIVSELIEKLQIVASHGYADSDVRDLVTDNLMLEVVVVAGSLYLIAGVPEVNEESKP